MKLLSIVGARPQFVKLAPLIRAIASRQATAAVSHTIVHTGQHYDAGMSAVFFEELQIPPPDFNLGVGSGRHGYQTGRMLEAVEQVLIDTMPDIVLVFGDTNSTLAGALAASKLHIPVAHLEAGLRSYNRRMPEEVNRVVTDHLADLLLVPTLSALENLKREGLDSRGIFVGDIMYEAVLQNRRLLAQRSTVAEERALFPGDYGVVTLHRSENTDEPARLHGLLEALNTVAASQVPLIFPVHPRTAQRLRDNCADWAAGPRLHLIQPLGYFDMLRLVANARVVLTDSGGLQKEAFFVGCPCVTLREETEWTETVAGGGNVLAGADPQRIIAQVAAWREHYPRGRADFSASVRKFFGSGNVSATTLKVLYAFHENHAHGAGPGRALASIK